jgi:rare lipoprotein A
MTYPIEMAPGARRPLALAALGLLLAGCVTAPAPVASITAADAPIATAAPPQPVRSTRMVPQRRFEGLASFYSHGTRVASGERFDPDALTAAHPSLPFGTKLKVSDPKSGKSVVVTVNDRGPFVRGRVLDLSRGAARALGMESRGVDHVTAQVL